MVAWQLKQGMMTDTEPGPISWLVFLQFNHAIAKKVKTPLLNDADGKALIHGLQYAMNRVSDVHQGVGNNPQAQPPNKSMNSGFQHRIHPARCFACPKPEKGGGLCKTTSDMPFLKSTAF
jgi:hypothetical protein